MSSACDTCRDPGACCRMFELNRQFRPDTSRERVKELLASGQDDFDKDLKWTPGLPFVAVRPSSWYAWPDEDKPHSVRWSFSCPKLGPDGRCTIYDERPELCRQYEPKKDDMCAEYEGPHHLRLYEICETKEPEPEPEEDADVLWDVYATLTACEGTGPSSSSSPSSS